MNSEPRHLPRQYNGFNQLLSVAGPSGMTSFGYDGNGNQVSKTEATGTTTYVYNQDNRLVGITSPTGSSAYEYDANGLRTKKQDLTGTRSYLLDGLTVIAEYAPDASKLAWYTQSLARIDEVLSVVNAQGKYWYEADALGSTYAMTNAAGVVVSRSSYDVFGERTLVAGTETGQPFGFTGREHDSSGLVYARARYLQPSLGKWTQPDPLGFVEGPNRYGYVSGMPTVRVDPKGLMSTNFENGDDSLRCVVGERTYPTAKAMYQQAQDFAFHGVLDAISGFGPEVNPSVGFASTINIGQYWALAEIVGSAPPVRFAKSLGARYADTAVEVFTVGAGPITISKLAIDKAISNPVFMAHVIVHEMAHYLRWSQGTGRRSSAEASIIMNMGLESQHKYYDSGTAPVEGYRSELAVFGSVRDHD